MPELERIALGETGIVPAVRTKTRQRKVHALIKLQFLWNDFEGGGALFVARSGMLATDDFGKDFLINVFDMIGKIFRFLRNLIMPSFGIFPAITFLDCFIFGQREIFLCDGFVVGKRRKVGRKKLTIVGSHVFDNTRHKFLVFFFRILFVEDTVFFI